MADFNKTILIGNLVKDPEERSIGGGRSVTNFTIALNRVWKGPEGQNGEEVSYIDCSAFGKTGEAINKYFFKGRRIFVEGRLKQEKWEDKETKKMQSKIRVVVENFNFMDSKKVNDEPMMAQSACGGEDHPTIDEEFDAI